MKIIIIGGGNMGLTFAKAFINSHIVNPDQLMILEKGEKEKINLLKNYNLAQIHTNPAKVKEAELVILSVKPQDAPLLFEQIKDHIDESQVVLSIMAGITIDNIANQLNVKKIIRAMPNLPSQIGQGMTAFTSTKDVSRFEEQWIQNLLQTTGKAINVRDEKMIDAVTAISGSGPAYIYYFMDAIMNAAIDMGFTKPVAAMLVQQTFSGALDLYKQNSYDCQEWIKMVSSKGGTTEAAIKFFEANNLNKKIADGTHAAHKRAIELGQ